MEFEYFLSDLDQSLRVYSRLGLILAGDFNSKNNIWGSRFTDRRGMLLADLITSHDFHVANVGDTPTFERGESTSVVDVTFYRGLVVSDWSVLDAVSLSDHRYIEFTVSTNLLGLPSTPAAVSPECDNISAGWSVKKLDGLALANFLESNMLDLPATDNQSGQAVAAAESINEFLTRACDASMPKRRPGPPNRHPAYWWTENIAEKRKLVFSLRRDYQSVVRASGHGASNDARLAYTLARKDLRLAIRQSKERG